jgi:hypothetical protein
MFKGLAELAMVGMVAIMIMVPALLIGACWLLWWLFCHVRFV